MIILRWEILTQSHSIFRLNPLITTCGPSRFADNISICAQVMTFKLSYYHCFLFWLCFVYDISVTVFIFLCPHIHSLHYACLINLLISQFFIGKDSVKLIEVCICIGLSCQIGIGLSLPLFRGKVGDRYVRLRWFYQNRKSLLGSACAARLRCRSLWKHFQSWGGHLRNRLFLLKHFCHLWFLFIVP